MESVKKGKELVASTENKVGVLANASSVIASAGVNVTAVCGYGSDGKAKVMFVTNNNEKAMVALKEKGYDVKEKDVVLVELMNKAGSLEGLAKKIAAAGINLNYIYGTVGSINTPATLVLSSDNNDKAVEVLQ